MNWDSLLESFGKITTESNSNDSSLEDITRVNPMTNTAVDITELLFDNATDNANHSVTNSVPIEYDLTNLDAISQFVVGKDAKKAPYENSWVNLSTLQTLSMPAQGISGNCKMEVESKAMQLALANEIEVQSPWVDVSALAASISEAPVSIKEKAPESISTLATFVPTHMQSYIDLNPEMPPTANLMSQNSFDLNTPTILDIDDKVFNDTVLISNVDSNKLDADIDKFLETTDPHERSLNTPPLSKPKCENKISTDDSLIFNSTFLNSNPHDDGLNMALSKIEQKAEINASGSDLFNNNYLKATNQDKDKFLNTPSPSKVQQNIEINPAISVLFNTDLALEDTLLFDNEPPSDMYVVRTENIFGKEIAKRNALKQLAADAGICSCTDCKCDPTHGECRNCNHADQSKDKARGCTEDTCNCIDCKCDHATMKCAVGCGRATDDNHNTFLHYHRRHNNSNLEELGVFTIHECEEDNSATVIDSLKCDCKEHSKKCASNSESKNSSKTESCCNNNSSKSCCVTICFKKLNAFKQFLSENDTLLQALKGHNLTTSL